MGLLRRITNGAAISEGLDASAAASTVQYLSLSPNGCECETESLV